MAIEKLSSIVSMFLDESNRGEKDYAKAYRIGMRCIKNELELDLTGTIFTSCFKLDSDKTLKLPDNFIKEISVSITKDGVPQKLNRNDKLNGKYLRDSFNLMMISEDELDSYLTSRVEYKLDSKANLLIFPPDFSYDEVEIEYLGRQKVDNDYEIDDRLIETIVAFIRWKWSMNDKNISSREKNNLERLFYNEKRKAKYRMYGSKAYM